MARKTSTPPKTIYRLKVTLLDIRPSIWRRIEVPGKTRLDHLHLMIQAAMGWYNCHLHSFDIGDGRYGMRDDEFDMDYEDEKDYTIEELVQAEKTRFLYTYDFGDNWEHEVLVEKIQPPESGAQYPRCTAGARACPPEDVGSTPGYAEFLDAISDPEHEGHDSYLEWAGGKFDPEAFEVKEVDVAVKDYKSMQVEG